MPPTFSIKNADIEGMQTMLDWAAEEGWNPGLDDAQSYYTADPNGFFIGYLDGKPIGCLSAVKYSPTFGFMGFYIVVPEYRGQGYGIQLWQHGIDYLQGCTIGLDGVVEQQSNYQRSGFELAFRNRRYQTTGITQRTLPESLCLFDSRYLDRVLAYERELFPVCRDQFMTQWLHQPNATVMIRKDDPFSDEGPIKGYGVLRQCVEGFKIGPLYANQEFAARDLLHAIRMQVPEDAPVFWDVSEMNEAAIRIASENSMPIVFETARMYKGIPPSVDHSRIYGITSFEIG